MQTHVKNQTWHLISIQGALPHAELKFMSRHSGTVPSSSAGWMDRLQRERLDASRRVEGEAQDSACKADVERKNEVWNEINKSKRDAAAALTVVHAYSTCWHRHTRLPEASFLGLSVKPYIHTADGEKEGEKQREIIQFDSMQKPQYGEADLHDVYWTQMIRITWIQSVFFKVLAPCLLHAEDNTVHLRARDWPMFW